MRRLTRAALALLCAASLTAACGGDDDDSEANAGDEPKSETTEPTEKGGSAAGKVEVSVASYDLAAGGPGRFLAGMYNVEKGAIAFGTARFAFFFLGESGSDAGVPGPTAEGAYLALPGSSAPPAGPSKTVYLDSADKGVYEAEVAFDKPGFWGVEATVDLEGKAQKARAAFKVLPKHEVPVAGEPAPLTKNLTMADAATSPAAVDSRGSSENAVPDPELHQKTVAGSIAAKRPVLLVISTPTFCVSRFCGPITDEAAKLAKTYSDRADFIHIEVWKNFEEKAINEAAAEWIAKGEAVQEPWVFLIGADGKIVDRWDNVATGSEIEPLLKALPALPG